MDDGSPPPTARPGGATAGATPDPHAVSTLFDGATAPLPGGPPPLGYATTEADGDTSALPGETAPWPGLGGAAAAGAGGGAASFAGLLPPDSRFRIIRFLARGGLGEVYVAEDLELHREVALKLIRERHADDPEARRRFLTEAEITSKLEHPGIVAVHGLCAPPGGRPHYAMRLIRGESLEAALRRLYPKPVPGEAPAPAAPQAESRRRGQELRRLVERIRQVGEAVQYAHNHGVLHRDLKPLNVMLDDYGETLVVDWGIAKARGRPDDADAVHVGSGDEGATAPGTIYGTLAYMAPEQARGETERVGPASDVFGLGATLYHSITGRPPYTGEKDGIRRQAELGRFPFPLAVNPQAPPALAAVCLRAMAFHPEDRYPSAVALADDLGRWLADEPIAVYLDPPAVRFLRWGKRHRTRLSAAATLLVTAVLTLTVAAVLLERAWSAAVQAKGRADAANRERARTLVVALQATRELQQAAADYLALVPGMAAKRRGVAASALTLLDRLLFDRPDDDKVRLIRVHTERELGLLDRLEGDLRGSERHYRAALDGLNRLPSTDGEMRSLRQRLVDDLGGVQLLKGKPREALENYRAMVREATRLVQDYPDRPAPGLTLGAVAHAGLGECELRTGRRAEAMAAYEEAALLWDKARDEGPRDEVIPTLMWLQFLGDYALILAAEGRPADALKVADRATAAARPLRDQFPGDSNRTYVLALALLARGQARGAQAGGGGEARGATAEARGLFDGLARDYPTVYNYRACLGRAAVQAARLQAVAGHLAPAIADADAARQALAALHDKQPQVIPYRDLYAEALGELARLLTRDGRVGEAGALLDKAVALEREVLDANPDDPDARARLDRDLKDRGALRAAGQ